MREFMTREHRNVIIPPTAAEFAEAARRGQTLTGDLLREMRATPVSKRSSTAATPQAATASSLADAKTIQQLQKRIEDLRKENIQLKIKVMTGK